ncbi:MAG: hypothetical protein ACI9OU_001605 [Candidatus Promineifilaceae bacterium]
MQIGENLNITFALRGDRFLHDKLVPLLQYLCRSRTENTHSEFPLVMLFRETSNSRDKPYMETRLSGIAPRTGSFVGGQRLVMVGRVWKTGDQDLVSAHQRRANISDHAKAWCNVL